MRCYLCERVFLPQPTWSQLFTTRYEAVICERCNEQFERIDGGKALFAYNAAMKDYLHRYKFLKDVALAQVFRQDIHRALRHRQELIVPVPLHKNRLQERTFSHVHELLEQADIMYTNMLMKCVDDRQSQKTLQQRQADTKRFDVLPHVPIVNKRIVIFDDIFTTGATIFSIQQLLYEHGASHVDYITLIQA